MSFLRHEMKVGDWTCDVRTSGYVGQRVATKLDAYNNVLEQLEWVQFDDNLEELPLEEQGLLVSIKKSMFRTCHAPQRVMEWLMTGAVRARDEVKEHVQEPDWLEVLQNPAAR